MLAFTTKQKELSSNRTAIHQSKGHYEMKSFASKSRSHGGGKRRPDQKQAWATEGQIQSRGRRYSRKVSKTNFR